MGKNYIMNVKSIQQNLYYDPQLSCDGGGYNQPLILINGVFEGDKFFFEYDNQSCGNFGKDITISLKRNGRMIYSYELNTLNERVENEMLIKKHFDWIKRLENFIKFKIIY